MNPDYMNHEDEDEDEISVDEYYEEIGNRLDNDEYVSEEETMEYLSAATGIPLEHLEAKLAKIRGAELLNCPKDI